MRVAIVVDGLLRGGAERQALYTARGLARHGCDVELVHYYRTDDDYDVGLAGDARVTYLPKGGQYLRFLARLARHLRAGRFDVVHSFKGSTCLYGGLAARAAGVPAIFGGYRQEYDDRGAMKLGHRVLSRVQSGWIANSRAVVDSLVREIGADPARCFVVDNAIDPELLRSRLGPGEARRRLGLATGAPVVSMVARFRPQKNHRVLVEAASRVLAERPETRFLLIGDGPEREAVQAEVERRGLADAVLLLGDRRDVPDLLAATDVSVLTSDYEGVSNALMESMCIGLAVVSTRYPGADELVTSGEDGLLAPSGDAEAVARSLLDLLGDPARREALGAAARRSIEARYGLDAMTRALLAVYARFVPFQVEPGPVEPGA